MKQLQETEGLKSKTLEDQPELYPDILWVWDLFDLLNRQRQIGMSGPQPISVLDLLAATQLKRLDHEEMEFVTRVIPQMDALFLNDYYKSQEKNRKTGSKGTKR